MCAIVLLTISPGFNVGFKEKPVDVVWVDIPKGTSDFIGVGLGAAPAAPARTDEPQEDGAQPAQVSLEALAKAGDQPAPEPGEPEQVAEKPAAKPAKKPTVEKSVTASARMTYARKGAPRIRRRPRTKTDRTIAGALASIDQSIAARSTPSGIAQPGAQPGTGTGYDGYKYGTGTEPLRVAPTDPEYLKYQAQVRSRIINNWVVPERFSTAGSSASAKLIVLINMNGEVVSVRWSQKSGSEAFNESARRAVQKSSPLPKPPSRLAWETYNEGFLIAFDARVR